MEDICFLTKCEKNSEGHPHSPREGKNKTQPKKESMQAKHKFFLVVTYIYKRSETIYKLKKNAYVQLFTAKKWFKENKKKKKKNMQAQHKL